jgi:HK97 family phage major capsid protein
MEVKELADMIQSAVSELHKATERQDAERAKFGGVTGETKSAVEKINTDITALMASRDEMVKTNEAMEVKLQRQTIPGAVAVAGPEAEAKIARKAAFYKYCRGGVTALAPEEQKALVEDATGQYLVEPELDAEIVRTLPKITVVRGLATVRTIGKDRIKMRSLGEVSVGWGKLETGSDITESSLLPGTPTYQYVEDLYGLAKIGEDELMDSDFNLEAILADSFSRAIAEAEDKAFIKGSGHDSNEPEGITVNAQLVTDQLTGADGAVTIENFLAMMYACPAQYRRNGAFVVNSATELLLRQLRETDTDGGWTGQFLWQPSVQAGVPNTFLGKSLHTQDDMLTVATASAVVAIFGDFKAGYRIIDRAGMTVQRLTELYSEAGLVGFKIHKRVGGSCMRASQKPLVLSIEG